MGSDCSKSASKKDKGGTESVEKTKDEQKSNEQQPYQIYDPDQYDQAAIKYLKEGLKNDTETFILNQMLMCTMFFDDYSEDITRCATATPENETLIREYEKELILPDTILKTVCQKFKYQPLEGPKRNQMMPLTSQRMYVLHNNVEIEDQKSSPANYSMIDKPSYQAKIEESKEHKGFVRINMLGPNETRSSFGSVNTESSEEKPNIQIRCVPSTSTGITHNDSGFNTESDYDYASITATKTPQKLKAVNADMYTHILQLPSKCFTSVRFKNINVYDSESENEDDKSDSGPIKAPSLFLINTYLNSCEFMMHFRDNIFPNYLGEVLDFPLPFIERATSIPGSIFCDSIDENNSTVNYEVTPAIAISWPDEIAFEWPLRPRVTVYDKRNGTAYQWPTEKMIEEAKQLKCVLIPRGFIPKRGDNPKMEIEWEVGFPKAERYLELRMTHAQMRVFLFILILYRTSIEPKTKKYGLLIEHIRHLMFWECEANYKDWPQDKLGIKLKQVLTNLYNYLSKRKLPHYFIRERNVLANVPNKLIFQTLEDIIQVIESPVIHMITALKDIKYNASTKFYPETDLDELYKIITSDNLYDLNVQISIMSYEQAKKKEIQTNDNNRKRDKEHEWNRRYLEAQRQKHVLKIIKKGVDNKEREQNSNVKPNELKVPIQKRFQNDTQRQILLLTFFIQQFIKISKRSLKISSSNQTLLYLKQAWYLSKLLEETDVESALTFQQQIKETEDSCQKKRLTEPTIPYTPRRNTYNNDIIQVKGKNINIAKLSKAYNENLYIKANSGNKKIGKKSPTFEPRLKTVALENSFESEDQVIEKATTLPVPIEKQILFSETVNIECDNTESTTL